MKRSSLDSAAIAGQYGMYWHGMYRSQAWTSYMAETWFVSAYTLTRFVSQQEEIEL